MAVLPKTSRGGGEGQADRSLRSGGRSPGNVPEEVLPVVDASYLLRPAHRLAHVPVGRVLEYLLACDGVAQVVRQLESHLDGQQFRHCHFCVLLKMY